MHTTTIKAFALAALMAMPVMATAQTFSGIEAEQKAQNTPSGWTAVQLPKLPAITAANTFNIQDYGASTTSEDNTKAIQAALNAVPATGGMVIIPAGTWMFGGSDQMTSTTEVLSIKSKTVLHLCAGATLKLVEYGKAPNNKTLFIGCKNRSQNDIVIEGEGETSVIDGDGARWWRARELSETFNPGAMIRFEQGSRFLVRNLKIQNTPGVNITLGNSGKASHATVHDVTISEPASDLGNSKSSHNTDGISIWGPYINIYDCNISNGDDNVVVDSDGRFVHVWNCKFGAGHGASLGSFTSNVHDVIYEGIDFDGTDSGFRLKSQRGRSGDVYNITFRDCTMKGVRNPIYIEAWYNMSTKPVPSAATAEEKTSSTPAFRDILIQNVTSTGTPYNSSAKANFPIYMYGLPESHVKNVTFDNVKVQAQKGMFIAFCDGVTFKNGCKITNTKESTKLVATSYQAEISGDYTGKTETPDTPGETETVSYTLDASSYTSSASTGEWGFANGFTISNDKSKAYASAKSNTVKYSKGVTFTITLPEGMSVNSLVFNGYGNEDEKATWLSELNGTHFDADTYSFAGRPTSGTPTLTSHEVKLASPASGSLTFTFANAQAAMSIQAKTTTSTGIAQVTTIGSRPTDKTYRLDGTLARNASAKGVYIKNGKKFFVK